MNNEPQPNLKPLSVAEEMRLKVLKKNFRDRLAQMITYAMQNSKNGKLEIPLPEIESYIEQAFLYGRDSQ